MTRIRKQANIAAFSLLLLLPLALAFGGGCGRKRDAATEQKPPDAGVKTNEKDPEPQKTLSATVQGVVLTLTNEKGDRIAHIKAKAAAVGPSGTGENGGGGAAIGVMTGGTATVYQEGKPAATLTADKMRADQAAGTVTGEGNVIARSLSRPDTPTIRADRMVWEQGRNEIRGTGKVLITRKPDFQMSGDSFVADTAMKTFDIQAQSGAASGTF